GAHAHHVRAVGRDDRAQVAQQAHAVPGDHLHAGGVDVAAGTPVAVDQALLVASVHVAAVRAVDGDASGAGDVTDDLVAGERLAPAGDLDLQAAGAQHAHALDTWARPRLRGDGRHLRRRGLRGRCELHEAVGEPLRREVTGANAGVQVLAVLEAQ